MTQPISHTRLIITIAFPKQPSMQRSLSVLVILTAIHRHKSWFSCCLTPYGQSMDILPNRGLVGLGMPGLGSLMWVAFLAGYTSTRSVTLKYLREKLSWCDIWLIPFFCCRIQGQLLLGEYGHPLIWGPRFLLLTKKKLQSGLSVISMLSSHLQIHKPS